MSQQNLKAIYREYIATMWNGRDLAQETALNYFDPNLVDHSAPPGQSAGLAGALQNFAMIQAAFPDWHIDSEMEIEEGDLLVVRLRTSGTHSGGSFFGIPASGRKFTSTGTHILRFKDGKMVEHWSNSDDLSMMQQLGAISIVGA